MKHACMQNSFFTLHLARLPNLGFLYLLLVRSLVGLATAPKWNYIAVLKIISWYPFLDFDLHPHGVFI